MRVVAAILQLYEESRLSKRDFCKEIGISTAQLFNWETKDGTKVRDTTVFRVADAFNKEIKWLNKSHTEVEFISKEKRQEWSNPRPMPPQGGYIPVVGLASAGEGITNFDEYEVGDSDLMVLKPYGLNDENAYGVLVEGDSMSPTLKPRQVVICSPNTTPQTGDIVVAKINGDECVIGEIHFSDTTITLKKHNPKYNDITIPEVVFAHPVVWVKYR